MRYAWLFLVLAGCSSKPNAQSCATIDKSSRAAVTLTWKMQHGSMDNDPPRAKVKLLVSGGAKSEVDLGELFGDCKLANVGALPDVPAAGSKITELECTHGNVTQYATVFVLDAGKIVVRRYERVDETLKPAKDIQTIDTPSCATFAADLAQAGEL
jgi:hypothetical protein